MIKSRYFTLDCLIEWIFGYILGKLRWLNCLFSPKILAMYMKTILKKNYLLKLLVAGDLLVLSLHLLLGGRHSFFHLDFEQNLPTIYQSVKLMMFGLVFLFEALRGRVETKLKGFVVPLSVFLFFLGFDELFQVHENIYKIFELFEWLHPSKIVEASMKLGYKSSLWILYYIPLIFVFVFWSGYWLRYFQAKMKENALLLVVSSVCLLSVLSAEIISSTGVYNPDAYFWLVTFEEVSEMILASVLIIIGSKTVFGSKT